MTEYWVSQKRHFCDFCKCWTADNKPSRDFHEKGKNHQKNVQIRISAMMKKGQAEAKEKDEMNATLKRMEQAAIKALKKDLKSDPSLASRYGVQLKSKESSLKPEQGPHPKPSTQEPSSSDKSQSQTDKSQSQTDKSQSHSEKAQSSGDKCDVNKMWKEEWTPEGFVYYWHVESGESVWVKPEGYIPTWERAVKEMNETDDAEDDDLILEPIQETPPIPEEDLPIPEETPPIPEETPPLPEETPPIPEETPEETPPIPEDPPPIPEDPPVESSHLKTVNNRPPLPYEILPHPPTDVADIPLPGACPPPEASLKRLSSSPEEDVVMPGIGPPTHRQSSKRAQTSAYGSWETIQHQTEEAPHVDLELPSSKITTTVEVSIPIAEPKIKFRQKKVDTLGAEFVAFKKRKLASASRRTTDTEKV